MHVIHLLLCEMPRGAFGGGPANSRRRPARLGAARWLVAAEAGPAAPRPPKG